MRYLIAPMFFLLLLGLPTVDLIAQVPIQYSGEPEELEIGGIEVKGVFFSDPNAIKSVAGLKVGQRIKIPGTDITRAMRNLWKLRLFDNVQITQDKRVGDIIFISIHLTERARLSGWSYRGVPQSVHDDLNDVVNAFLIKGQVASTAMQINAKNAIEKFYIEKGNLDATVEVWEEPANDHNNAVNLIFQIKPGEKVKIGAIQCIGCIAIQQSELRKHLKETKPKSHLLKKSKFVESDYEADKQAVIDHYHSVGYRDAMILRDSMFRDEDGLLNIVIWMHEGEQYYFGDISWKGNTVHTSDQ